MCSLTVVPLMGNLITEIDGDGNKWPGLLSGGSEMEFYGWVGERTACLILISACLVWLSFSRLAPGLGWQKDT